MATSLKLVIDTNVLLTSVSDRSENHWLWLALLQQNFSMFITSEILLEYEEVFAREWNPMVAENVVNTLLRLPNVFLTETHYQWELIYQDRDDNKFVDCAFSNNVDYLISDDRHYKILKKIKFPKIIVLKLFQFKEIYSNS